MERFATYLFSACMVGLVVTPALRDPPVDSFPLSDYPMFSAGRPSPDLVITHALGVLASGERIPLPPPISADTVEVLQSMTTIRRAIEGGPTLMSQLCRAAARRLREQATGPLANSLQIELATSRYDSVAYFSTSSAPLERQVHASCQVGR